MGSFALKIARKHHSGTFCLGLPKHLLLYTQHKQICTNRRRNLCCKSYDACGGGLGGRGIPCDHPQNPTLCISVTVFWILLTTKISAAEKQSKMERSLQNHKVNHNWSQNQHLIIQKKQNKTKTEKPAVHDSDCICVHSFQVFSPKLLREVWLHVNQCIL